MKTLPTNKHLKSLVKIVYASIAISSSCFIYLKGVLPLLYILFQPNEQFSTIIRRLGLFIVFISSYWVFMHFFEKRKVTEMYFQPLKIILGIISGSVLISMTMLVLFTLGYYEVVSYQGYEQVMNIIGIILILAIAEEFFFRGILFQFLEQGLGTKWALLIVSVLFGILHIFNEGATLVTIMSGTIISALWTLIYINSRNLWVIGLHHAAWNLAIFLSGIPLSGQEKLIVSAPYKSIYHGPEILTGGAFGPENSILTIIIGLLSIFFMIKFMKQKRALR